MFRSLLCLFSLLSTIPAMAAPRVWSSADGNSSFTGEFVSHDGQRVTIRHEKKGLITFDKDKLSKADRTWLTNQRAKDLENDDPIPDPNAVFDTLCFGDDRKVVTEKLKKSKLVETQLDDSLFGRFGLNGTFRTRQKIGGLHCALFFDWSKASKLKEISLQTDGKQQGAYDDLLRGTWSELAELLTRLHGNALQKAGFPDAEDLENDLFLASHLWRLDGGGTALLGTAMQAGQYMVVVRFTTERLEPNRVP